MRTVSSSKPKRTIIEAKRDSDVGEKVDVGDDFLISVT